MYNINRIKEMRKTMNRESGILLHISSLPGKYGIGDFGKEAYKFIDFLKESDQKNWQILPLGITGYGDSPYQSFSAFAGNPYFIDIEEFIEKEYISEEDVNEYNLKSRDDSIDYNKLYKNKYKLLRLIYNKDYDLSKKKLEEFYIKEKEWLRPFALFMTIKDYQQGKSWLEWEDRFKEYDSKSVQEFENKNKKDLFFWVFTQFYFFTQWKKLKKYANNRNINIIGDMPVYVAEDSSDIWANSKYFNLDKDLKPKTVAGVPPDLFSEKGQLWGNPIYNWENMKKNNYKWWIKRIKHSFRLFDKLRIDHFRGFEAYWEVEKNSKDAVKGKWVKGPGLELFNEIKKQLGNLDIIAEDLGFLTKEVHNLIDDTGYPGMKVLQFAFDGDSNNPYLPHNYCKNSVVYTGTHDNQTTKDWFASQDKESKKYIKDYIKEKNDKDISWKLIKTAWSSTADLAIAPMQDFLNLGNESRMNTPATLGDNWTWRLASNLMKRGLSEKISHITQLYGR
jgi:4-alpha-glucanotransferase